MVEKIVLGKYRHYKNKEYNLEGIGVFSDLSVKILGFDSKRYYGTARYSENPDYSVDVYKIGEGKFTLVSRQDQQGQEIPRVEYAVYRALYEGEFGRNVLWIRPLRGAEGFFMPKIIDGREVLRFALIE